MLAVLRRLGEQLLGDLDHLAFNVNDAGVLVDLPDGEGRQFAPAQAAVGGGVGYQLIQVPVHPGG
jgi:hypothetical protein